MQRLVCLGLIFITIHACTFDSETENPQAQFESITYFKVNGGLKDALPYKFRYTYYYDNGHPYRYTIVDSSNQVLTDYFYYYDAHWKLTEARYKEEGESEYSIEKFAFNQDNTTKTTTWIDSTGSIYYTMVENLVLRHWRKSELEQFKGFKPAKARK